MHLSSRRWLATRRAHAYDGPTVVLTHHAPLIRTRPAAPELRALAGAFASDMTDLMGGDRVALSTYGHTQPRSRLDAAILSNPYGYREQSVAGFDPACVTDLGLGPG